jgi:hypothetical protein
VTDVAPRKGDRVRVTYEAMWDDPPNYPGWMVRLGQDTDGNERWADVPQWASVEVLERADDPGKDVVGTVRDSAYGSAVKLRHNEWRVARDDKDEIAAAWSDEAVRNGGWPVIGVVPGTPAAEAHATQDAINVLVENRERVEATLNAPPDVDSTPPGPLPCPVTPKVLADDSPLTLLRTAERIARDHGDTARADRFEDAAKDHGTAGCRAGGPCTAERDARKALTEYGYDVNGVAW